MLRQSRQASREAPGETHPLHERQLSAPLTSVSYGAHASVSSTHTCTSVSSVPARASALVLTRAIAHDVAVAQLRPTMDQYPPVGGLIPRRQAHHLSGECNRHTCASITDGRASTSVSSATLSLTGVGRHLRATVHRYRTDSTEFQNSQRRKALHRRQAILQQFEGEIALEQ